MADLIIIGIVALMVVPALIYILRAKKSGVKCIGCPSAGKCAGGCGGNCSGNCNCENNFDK